MKFPQAQAHPWHGISPGEHLPEIVQSFIEIVPSDTVKYEIDKPTGHLRVDRPQRYSNQCPTLYGFVPQTYCGNEVAKRCMERTARRAIRGDGDPLDICIFTEREITHGNILVRAQPIGGLRMIDGEEADDKIIAVLVDDAMYGAWRDLADIPVKALERLQHYFLTYKDMPGSASTRVEIAEIYSKSEAHEVITRAVKDYETLVTKNSSLPGKYS